MSSARSICAARGLVAAILILGAGRVSPGGEPPASSQPAEAALPRDDQTILCLLRRLPRQANAEGRPPL